MEKEQLPARLRITIGPHETTMAAVLSYDMLSRIDLDFGEESRV
jgi:hypothetical protein